MYQYQTNEIGLHEFKHNTILEIHVDNQLGNDNFPEQQNALFIQ